jgi:hypothetical protein
VNRLFATTVTNAKPRDRDYKLTDGEGLFLLVRPNGSKLWRMNYKYLGRCRTLGFGAWPEASLADARVKREEARRRLPPASISRTSESSNRRVLPFPRTIASSWLPRNGSRRTNAKTWRRSR